MRTGSNQPKYLTESQLGQTAGPNVDMAGRFSVQGHRRYCLGIPTTTNKLLMHKDAHSGPSSEGALILQANWSDFDSAIPWFESRRPSQPVRSPPTVSVSLKISRHFRALATDYPVSAPDRIPSQRCEFANFDREFLIPFSNIPIHLEETGFECAEIGSHVRVRCEADIWANR